MPAMELQGSPKPKKHNSMMMGWEQFNNSAFMGEGGGEGDKEGYFWGILECNTSLILVLEE